MKLELCNSLRDEFLTYSFYKYILLTQGGVVAPPYPLCGGALIARDIITQQ